MAAEPSDFIVGAVNTDATNAHFTLNSFDKMGDDLCARFNQMNLSLMTLSEVSTVSSVKHMCRVSNDKSLDYTKAGVGQSLTVQIWDSERFKLLDQSSAYAEGLRGQFLSVPYKLKETEEDYLHISVHLPNKNGRRDAYLRLQKYIAEQIEEDKFKSIFVHGDFNMNSSLIQSNITSSLTPTVPFSVVTTSGNRSIDNFAFHSSNVDYEASYRTVASAHNYSHFPLSTAVSDSFIETTVHTYCQNPPSNTINVSNNNTKTSAATTGAKKSDSTRCVLVKGAYRKVHDEATAGVHHYVNASGNVSRFKSYNNGTTYPLKEILTNISSHHIV